MRLTLTFVHQWPKFDGSVAITTTAALAIFAMWNAAVYNAVVRQFYNRRRLFVGIATAAGLYLVFSSSIRAASPAATVQPVLQSFEFGSCSWMGPTESCPALQHSFRAKPSGHTCSNNARTHFEDVIRDWTTDEAMHVMDDYLDLFDRLLARIRLLRPNGFTAAQEAECRAATRDTACALIFPPCDLTCNPLANCESTCFDWHRACDVSWDDLRSLVPHAQSARQLSSSGSVDPRLLKYGDHFLLSLLACARGPTPSILTKDRNELCFGNAKATEQGHLSPHSRFLISAQARVGWWTISEWKLGLEAAGAVSAILPLMEASRLAPETRWLPSCVEW